MTDDIRIALMRAGISQIQLAASLQIHPSTVSRIANGWLVPSREVQLAIRRKLGRHGRQIRFGGRLEYSMKKIKKLKQLLNHVVEQAQRHQFLNAIHTLEEINLLLLSAHSCVSKEKVLEGWGSGTTFDQLTKASKEKVLEGWGSGTTFDQLTKALCDVSDERYLAIHRVRAFDAAERECIENNPLPLDILIDSLGLCGEVGEVAEAVKKMTWAKCERVGLTMSDVPQYKQRFQEELGDVMFHWLRLCRLAGATVEDVLNKLALKMRDRNVNGKQRNKES